MQNAAHVFNEKTLVGLKAMEKKIYNAKLHGYVHLLNLKGHATHPATYYTRDIYV